MQRCDGVFVSFGRRKKCTHPSNRRNGAMSEATPHPNPLPQGERGTD